MSDTIATSRPIRFKPGTMPGYETVNGEDAMVGLRPDQLTPEYDKRDDQLGEGLDLIFTLKYKLSSAVRDWIKLHESLSKDMGEMERQDWQDHVKYANWLLKNLNRP